MGHSEGCSGTDALEKENQDFRDITSRHEQSAPPIEWDEAIRVMRRLILVEGNVARRQPDVAMPLTFTDQLNTLETKRGLWPNISVRPVFPSANQETSIAGLLSESVFQEVAQWTRCQIHVDYPINDVKALQDSGRARSAQGST